MIKIQDLKIGDYVLAEYEGEKWEGMVKELNKEDKEVCIQTEVQEFWFKPEALFPIPLALPNWGPKGLEWLKRLSL